MRMDELIRQNDEVLEGLRKQRRRDSWFAVFLTVELSLCVWLAHTLLWRWLYHCVG